MAKQTISYLKVFENNGANGAYKTLSIQTDKHGKEYISCPFNAEWAVGKEIDIEVEEYTKKTGAKGLKMVKKDKAIALANNSKIEEILNGQLTIKLYLRKIMRALKIEDDMSDVEKARENYNASRPVSDGYTSRGADGEAPIKASDVNFNPREVKYPEDDINPEDIPF